MKSNLRMIGAFLVAILITLGLTACKVDGQSAANGDGSAIGTTRERVVQNGSGPVKVNVRAGASQILVAYNNAADKAQFGDQVYSYIKAAGISVDGQTPGQVQTIELVPSKDKQSFNIDADAMGIRELTVIYRGGRVYVYNKSDGVREG